MTVLHALYASASAAADTLGGTCVHVLHTRARHLLRASAPDGISPSMYINDLQ